MKSLTALLSVLLMGCWHAPPSKPIWSNEWPRPVKVSKGEFRCSGVQIHADWAMTAAHCYADPLWFDDILATVVIPFPRWDLAVANAPGLRGPDIVWPDHKPMLGEPAILAGFGCSDGESLNVRRARVVKVEDREITYDAPACEGDSGGPVVDLRGAFVGLIVQQEPLTHHAIVEWLGEGFRD